MNGLKAAVAHPPEDARRYVEAGYWTDDIQQDWLAAWADKRPDAPAAVCVDRTVSYGAMYDQARRVACGLLDLGLARGDVIGMQLPNSPETMAVFHGIEMMGGVAALLHMPYRAGELSPMLGHVGAKAVFCFNGLADYDAPATMRQVAEKVPSLETVIVIGGEAPADAVRFDDLIAKAPQEIADPPRPDDPAMIAFTSGTSASPKAVVHTYRSMASSFRIPVPTMGWGPDDIVLSAPPFTHAFGVIVLMTALCAGSAMAIMPAYSPPALAETIKETKATSICLGPAHIFANAAAGLLTPEIMASVRSAFVGGAACPPEAIQTLQDACPNGTVYQIWGMTEVLLAVVSPLDAPLDTRLTSIGTMAEGHDLRIVDANGTVLPPGEEGELQMRGPFLFHRYMDNDEANEAAFTEDNFFRTGDLMKVDRDGNLVMTGRVKDVVNRGGIKINPVDIELFMDKHPDVVQCAVVPFPDKTLGERACLVIVPAPGKHLSLDDLRGYLEGEGVAKLRWPEKVIEVASMPMTPTRKIIKGRLVQQIADQLEG
jgi:cyclohexanecarboxylate-CoA ligase